MNFKCAKCGCQELIPVEAPSSPSLPLDIVSLDFESLYEKYPKRLGSQRKKDGLRICRNQFVTLPEFLLLEKSILNYHAHCRREGKLGTELVLQFKTFVSSLWEEWIPTTNDFDKRAENEKRVAETKRQLELSVPKPVKPVEEEETTSPEEAKKAIAAIMSMGGFMRGIPE